ncbi:MAG TPA: four helix bundle protein [Nitrospiraceae bacterium]|nr:four helix bundle protein [Nitrospiraceae bacterium]
MTKFKDQSSNQLQSSKNKVFDLEERTARFGEDIILFAKSIVKDEVSRPLIGQLIRSGTSIGANYMEADGAESKRDFRHKIALCKKEAKETKHWLRMMAKADPGKNGECKHLWVEAKELTLIFSSILLQKKPMEKKSFD